MSTEYLSRSDLYDLVWSEPISQLARKLGLSDVGLAKLCDRHEIPRPERGYWAKLRSGKPTRTRPLRPASSDDLEQTHLVLGEPSTDGTVHASPEDEPRIAYERDASNAVVVPEQVDELHPLVAATVKSLRAAKPDERGLVSPRAKRCLNVRVTPAQIDRAARILHALIEALEARDLTVQVRTTPQTGVVVHVDDEALQFSLVEKLRRHDHELTPREQQLVRREPWKRYSLPQYDYEATGLLTLSIDNVDGYNGAQKTWSDTPRTKLESRLNSVIIGFYKAARNNCEERKRREQRQREFEERQRIAEQQRKAEALEKARIEDLDRRLEAWKRVRDLRAFIAQVVQNRDQGKYPEDERAHLDAWLEWAEAYVDSLDPIKNPDPPFQLDPPPRRNWPPASWGPGFR